MWEPHFHMNNLQDGFKRFRVILWRFKVILRSIFHEISFELVREAVISHGRSSVGITLIAKLCETQMLRRFAYGVYLLLYFDFWSNDTTKTAFDISGKQTTFEGLTPWGRCENTHSIIDRSSNYRIHSPVVFFLKLTSSFYHASAAPYIWW